MSQPLLGSINLYALKDNKLLLGRRANTGWMDGYLCPPGGHVEPGETPTAALIREMQEELGVTLDPKDFEFLSVAARQSNNAEYVAYEFILRDKDYDFVNNEENKCSELIWAALDNLPDDIIPHFREVIDQCLLGDKKYLELGYDS
jgi:8-oxo-dGTP diphosphatase